ncbi:uncharacterized protein STEHIDRAFT_116065 [Stereum hirsutum FP-91666 SS1]|uniref:F-box domain-containing protein n=1 Tax=Stereum hirsutum (strain FP-91666) TaxID=721885 RepID=R7RZG5_STEHR|nr:uncharacterized protein STEHIDRAFT_116065 [Stereum hirsutum FP-91666 SS1]EIM80223.1 hypothetical protein STEHIDRAFT_116065 [Stereum hirsutum FP-91666 SS1]
MSDHVEDQDCDAGDTELPIIPPIIFSLIRDKPSRSTLGWIRITHVCRSWREIAIGSPILWTATPFQLGKYWMEEFLRRSEPVPAKIYWSPTVSSLPLSEIPIASIQARLSSLSIGVTTSKEALKRLLQGFPTSVPVLEELRIAYLNRSGTIHHSTVPAWMTPRDAAANSVILTSLLNVLQATPVLQSLEIRNQLPSTGNVNDPVIPPLRRLVPLNSLCTLVIRGGLSCLVGRLIQSLYIPLLANGDFEATYRHNHDFQVYWLYDERTEESLQVY